MNALLIIGDEQSITFLATLLREAGANQASGYHTRLPRKVTSASGCQSLVSTVVSKVLQCFPLAT